MAKKVTKKKQIAAGRSLNKRTKKSRPQKATSPKAEEEIASMDARVTNQKSYLTSEQLNFFRELLLKKLEEITGDVDNIESGALKSSRADATGDLSSMPIHMADIGSDNYEQEFSLGLMHSEREIVREIIAAIRRIDNGTYGICEGTGEPIPLTRLNGIPWARYCIKYAAKQEKGKAGRQERLREYSGSMSDEDRESAADQGGQDADVEETNDYDTDRQETKDQNENL